MSSASYVCARAYRLRVQSLFNDAVNMTLCTTLNCRTICGLWLRKDVEGSSPGRVPAAPVYSWGVQTLKTGSQTIITAGSRAARVNKHSTWYINAYIVTWNTTLADYTFSCPILLHVRAVSDHHWVVFELTRLPWRWEL